MRAEYRGIFGREWPALPTGHADNATAVLGRFEQLLMRLTLHELGDRAVSETDSSFQLLRSPEPAQVPTGLYELPRRSGEAHTYRLNHPLAEWALAQAKERDLPAAELQFSLSDYEGRITVLEPFIGRSGYLAASLLTIDSLDQSEDHIILAAVDDQDEPLDEDGGEEDTERKPQ